MRKKLLSLSLALVLILGMVSTSFANGAYNIVPLNNTGKAQVEISSTLERDKRAEGISDKDVVRIIVELEDSPIIDNAIRKGIKVEDLDRTTYGNLNNQLLKEQERIKANIEKEKIDLEYHNSFINVVNGFSATTTFEAAKKIEKLSGVNKVTIANVYERPRPHMDTSKDIISAIETWGLDYDGEGMVVSIIDTGVDPDHKDMVLTNSNNGKITEKDVMLSNLKGKYYTTKVPYGYNYADNNHIILDLGPDASHHGMHVAGTVGANGEIKGVSPEAQLLAMKVFGNDPGMPSTFGDIIIKAIDDSIKLGADVINMSLGSTSSFVQPDDPEQMAVARAIESGVVCAISAGNSQHIGYGYADPFVENPDYGLVGSPGLSVDSIQVASVENTHVKADGLRYEGGIAGYAMAGNYDPVKVFANKKVEYINCEDGSPEFLTEVSGKVALVVRGGNTSNFTDKIANAIAAGAAGIIVRNHESGGEALVNMMYPDGGTIPAVFIGYKDGKALVDLISEGKNFVEFKGDKAIISNPDKGKMSTFTSWGPTPDLSFKPEITAPGGQIYSTLQNNSYGLMSGTSMAAPHVAGGSALIMQRVEKDFNLTGKDKAEMVKNLIMSTANPITERFGYTSPRRQGAGVMNLYGAATTPTIITDARTGISKVELKEIGNNVEFTLEITNFIDEKLTYNIYSVLQTDVGYFGDNWVEPQPVENAPMIFEDMNGEEIESIEVPANGSVRFKVNIDLSEAIEWAFGSPIKEIFENGTFIDGFIFLEETTDNYPALNIPYMGFYGEWDEAPIIDPSVYEDEANYFYGLTSLTWLDGTTYRFLGFPFNDGNPDTKNMSFSPNGDGLADTVRPVLSFLRNAKEVRVNILDENGDIVRRLSHDEYIRKNYYDNGRGSMYRSLGSWEWDGEVYGEIIEGQYIYQIESRIDYPNSDWQKLEFPVKVDITAPILEKLDFNKDTKTITIIAKDNITPIYKYEVLSKGKVLIETDNNVIDLSTLTNVPHEITVKAYDYALNFVESDPIKLSEDTTIPYIFMEEPEAWEAYNTNIINVRGYVVDSSGLVELKINGSPVEFEYNIVDEKYYFETTLNYEDGVNKILVEGKDKANNEIKFERKIFVDTTKPTLEVLMNPTRIVSKDTQSVKVKIKVTENSGDVKVIVHGNQVFNNPISWEYVNEFNMIEKELEIDVPLKYGENNIKVVVIDGFGNRVEKLIGRTYRKLF